MNTCKILFDHRYYKHMGNNWYFIITGIFTEDYIKVIDSVAIEKLNRFLIELKLNRILDES